VSQELSPLAVIPPGLTNEEAEFVYNVEVLDLPTKKAAQLAGLPYSATQGAHIKQAREMVRADMRGNLQVTREDVTFGLKEAINRARLLSEPMTEIAGWDRLMKLHGLDAPQKIDVNLTASVAALKGVARNMSDAELARLVNANDIVDAVFYEVPDGPREG
jgi:hypothetical protein